MERVTFMIGSSGPFVGAAMPANADPILSIEFGGLDLQDDALFRTMVSVSYADGTTVSGNMHSMSFAQMAGGTTGKIDFSRLPAVSALIGAA